MNPKTDLEDKYNKKQQLKLQKLNNDMKLWLNTKVDEFYDHHVIFNQLCSIISYNFNKFGIDIPLSFKQELLHYLYQNSSNLPYNYHDFKYDN